MVEYVLKQENYNASKETIRGISKDEYLKQISDKFDEFVSKDCCKEVYTDMPDDVSEWFDKSGVIIVRLKEGYEVTDETYPMELHTMLMDISNENGILILLNIDSVWKEQELEGYNVEEEEDVRRIK